MGSFWGRRERRGRRRGTGRLEGLGWVVVARGRRGVGWGGGGRSDRANPPPVWQARTRTRTDVGKKNGRVNYCFEPETPMATGCRPPRPPPTRRGHTAQGPYRSPYLPPPPPPHPSTPQPVRPRQKNSPVAPHSLSVSHKAKAALSSCSDNFLREARRSPPLSGWSPRLPLSRAFLAGGRGRRSRGARR
jgi:hypothetical protein